MNSKLSVSAMIFGALIATLILLASATANAHVKPPVKIILDTDFGDDGDDLAALCVLHRMADLELVELLAVGQSNSSWDAPGAIDVINTYYGRPDIPIGQVKHKTHEGDQESDDSAASRTTKIPVICDSDIGDDIDDTWALCMVLRCPELDVRLVVGDQGKPEYRTKLFARFLEIAKRTDIPIGVALDRGYKGSGPQGSWVADLDLKSYPGTIHQDGVQAIIDTIMKSPEPVTVIAVGPMPNIQEALKREPRIAEKARFVGMYGHVRTGSEGKTRAGWYEQIQAEYNVSANVEASQATLSAPWDITITPLDTCAMVSLKGDMFVHIGIVRGVTEFIRYKEEGATC